MLFVEKKRGGEMKHYPYVFWFVLFVMAIGAPAWAAAPAGGGNAGTEACLSCHENQAKLMSKSPHWKKAVPGSPINSQGCETCHGSGAAHAEAGGGKGVGGLTTFGKGESAQKKSAVCLSCHENSPKLALWDSGVHKKQDVACSDCHTLHGTPKAPMGYGTGLSPLGYSPGVQYQTCGKCHLDIKAQINRRSHHPIIEGRVTCSDCHNPHGSMGPSQIKADSVNQLCYKCHAEKRGPFMWEHQPVAENCEACHTPHGGVHPTLLKEKVPNLCQGCHEGTRHPATRYSRETMFNGAAPNARGFGRACLNCHINIHGSNAPANPGNLGNSGTYFLR
jgi:DmsE family decaheme c-type cytochrome